MSKYFKWQQTRQDKVGFCVAGGGVREGGEGEGHTVYTGGVCVCVKLIP